MGSGRRLLSPLQMTREAFPHEVGYFCLLGTWPFSPTGL